MINDYPIQGPLPTVDETLNAAPFYGYITKTRA